MKKLLKRGIQLFLIFLVAGIVFAAWANYSIKMHTEDFLSDAPAGIPQTKTGLLLGTGKMLDNGQPNAYFYNRITAAAELYKSGKIQYLIVSGDNSTKAYNEPEDMQKALVARGVPEQHIFMDFAGFRTLDSVVRAKEIFGQRKIVVISQKFHNERAVFLAQQNGMEAYGFNAEDVSKYAGLKTNAREYLAKTKAYLDLMTGTEPKFGGKKIRIP